MEIFLAKVFSFRPIAILTAGTLLCGLAVTAQVQGSEINDMGRACTQKIGVIEPFSCLDGEIIPITVNGTTLAPGQQTSVCDRPSFLAPAYCNPFSRVGRLPSLGPDGRPDEDVQNVFVCRRYNWVTDPSNPDFKDVAIIQHRKSTGETCFFQHLTDYLNSTRVPPPAEPSSQTPPGRPTADAFWLPPTNAAAIGCNRCHDIGPFIHSPYIDQVKINTARGPETIVFPLPDLRRGEANNYRFLGAAFQRWGIPDFIKPANNRCVECHIFGTQMSSSTYTKYSTGRLRPQHITDAYAQYPNSHWMPPDQAHEMPIAIYNRLYQEPIDQILECNSAHTMIADASCNRQPFGP